MSSSPLRFGDLNRYAQAELPLLILLIHRIQRTLAFASESSEQAISIEEFYTKYCELASDAVESLVSLLFFLFRLSYIYLFSRLNCLPSISVAVLLNYPPLNLFATMLASSSLPSSNT